MRDFRNMGAALICALALTACQSEVQTPAAKPAEVQASTSVDYFDTEWTAADSQPILDKTMRLRITYDDSQLTANEKRAVKELLAAGARLHTLYLDQIHPQARDIEAKISDPAVRQDLKDLFRMMKGPMLTNLDNERVGFLNADATTQAKNVYPLGTKREDLKTFFAAHPDRKDEILDLRAVVISASFTNKQAALKTLDNYPSLERLHPGLRNRIKAAEVYFGLPYSVRYAEDIFYVYDRLQAAADHIAGEDIAFARYLRLRARDMLADNYDGSDAMWITGDYTGNLNAHIEDALPYAAQKQVRNRIPVGVYNIIADFGQSRGTNTATILPNEGHLSRQFGRTILIRSNVLRSETLYETGLTSFKAATDPRHHNDLAIEGNFYRTLWHEIGHYLGPDQTKDGGDIDAALQESADMFEEMKSDLVSLFSVPRLHKAGALSDKQLRSILASGILRVTRKNQPRRSQAYGTMQLMQFNWFMDKGLLKFENGSLQIDYDKYNDAVSSLLGKIIAIQYEGNRKNANGFVDQWTNWDDDLHGVIADKMKAAETYRYRLVTYEALGE